MLLTRRRSAWRQDHSMLERNAPMPRALSRDPHKIGPSAASSVGTESVGAGAVTTPVDDHVSRLDTRKSHIQISEIWMRVWNLEFGCLPWRRTCRHMQAILHASAKVDPPATLHRVAISSQPHIGQNDTGWGPHVGSDRRLPHSHFWHWQRSWWPLQRAVTARTTRRVMRVVWHLEILGHVGIKGVCLLRCIDNTLKAGAAQHGTAKSVLGAKTRSQNDADCPSRCACTAAAAAAAAADESMRGHGR
jgi:hypothetical protein